MGGRRQQCPHQVSNLIPPALPGMSASNCPTCGPHQPDPRHEHSPRCHGSLVASTVERKMGTPYEELYVHHNTNGNNQHRIQRPTNAKFWPRHFFTLPRGASTFTPAASAPQASFPDPGGSNINSGHSSDRLPLAHGSFTNRGLQGRHGPPTSSQCFEHWGNPTIIC